MASARTRSLVKGILGLFENKIRHYITMGLTWEQYADELSYREVVPNMEHHNEKIITTLMKEEAENEISWKY